MQLKNTKAVTLKDGSKVSLRSPALEDAEAYIDFSKEVFSHSEFLVTQIEEYQPDLVKQKDYIEAALKKPNSLIILAEYESSIVGVIDFRVKSESKRLSHRGDFGLSIVPAWRGKGLGKVLIESLVDWAQGGDNSIEKIELIVAVENRPAFHLYKKMGFEVEGTIKNELKISEDKYLDSYLMGLWLKG